MYDPVYELEHFGIPGMKWGVRRTPAQLGHKQEAKLNRYKEKEIKKVNKRIATIEKNRQDFEKRATIKSLAYKNNPNPTEKQKRRYEANKKFYSDELQLADAYKKTALKEIEAVKKMSYKDMQKEKLEIGAVWATTILAGVGASVISPASLVVIPMMDTSTIKTQRRLQFGAYAKKKPKVSKKKPNVSK